jgi:hypothetical protein
MVKAKAYGGRALRIAVVTTALAILLLVGSASAVTLWQDDYNSYTALPTDKYDFKYGTFSLVDLGSGDKAIYQDKSYTGESYAMIPKGLVINSKNYEITFRGRAAIWAGIHVTIGNSSTVWTNNYGSGNEGVGFAPDGFSSDYPPFIHLWSNEFGAIYPRTGDIGTYDDWRWVKVVSNETNLTAYYGGMGVAPQWAYIASIPHGAGNENPPYYIAFYWGNERGYIDDITVTGDVSNSIGYSATIATGQNTFVQASNGTFGLLLKGQSKTINNSVILNNTGDISAKIEARFNDSISGVFGLVSGANVLNATNFALGLPSSLVILNSSGADVQVAVAPPGVTALDARLGVPNEQAAGDYSGTVVLTFSNNVQEV